MSDEDSDSDEATSSGRHRDRFRTERRSSTSTSAPTAASKVEKRDIPDTLGETNAECDYNVILSTSVHKFA